MNNHNCIIGLIYDLDYCHLITKNQLVEYVDEKKELNKIAETFNYPLKQKIWELSDYADKRKSTDLTRFDFCPFCGNKIDWKKIKFITRENDNER